MRISEKFNMPAMERCRRRDSGATAIEYVIAVSILLSVFIMTAAVVGGAIRDRSAASAEVAGNYAPCGVVGEVGHLNSSECQ